MNAEHQALAEYLGDVFEKKLDQKLDQRLKNQSKDLFSYMDRRFDKVDAEFKEIHRIITTQIDFVDRKNAEQDDEIEDHESRISVLESDYRVLTS